MSEPLQTFWFTLNIVFSSCTHSAHHDLVCMWLRSIPTTLYSIISSSCFSSILISKVFAANVLVCTTRSSYSRSNSWYLTLALLHLRFLVSHPLWFSRPPANLPSKKKNSQTLQKTHDLHDFVSQLNCKTKQVIRFLLFLGELIWKKSIY